MLAGQYNLWMHAPCSNLVDSQAIDLYIVVYQGDKDARKCIRTANYLAMLFSATLFVQFEASLATDSKSHNCVHLLVYLVMTVN